MNITSNSNNVIYNSSISTKKTPQALKTCVIYLDTISKTARCEYSGTNVSHPATRDNIHTLIYSFQQRGFFVTLYEISRPKFFPPMY